MDRRLQQQLEEDPVLEQAAEWFAELQGSDVSLQRMAEWQRWMGDERHRNAYTELESMWDIAAPVSSSIWPSTREVSSDRYDPAQTISAWKAARTRSTARYALAASVLLAVALAASQMSMIRNWLSPSSVVVETRTGEMRTLRLSDGSTVEIGGHSSVSASLTAHAREIHIDSGEAFFDVAKDPKRPFIVRAGNNAIVAIGTRFNVRRGEGQDIVAIAEGIVQITAPGAASADEGLRLAAGEQVSVSPTGAVLARQTIDAQAVGGWRAGKLQYLDEPLSAVVADVRRYVARDIEIADQAVGALRITGTVFENDIDSWLHTLEAAFPLRVTRAPGGKTVLRSAGN